MSVIGPRPQLVRDLVVFSTPFDLDSVDFLNSIGQSLWKIPSGEITNLPYLKRISCAFKW